MPASACLRMDRLLELTYRADASHFWFRGFRQYITPALAPRHRRPRPARASSIAAAAPARTSRCSSRYGQAVGFDLTRIGTEFARRTAATASRRPASATSHFSSGRFDLVTSFDVFQVLPDDVERSAIARDGAGAEAGRRRCSPRRRARVLHGKHSALSEETRRYTPVAACARLSRARASESSG